MIGCSIFCANTNRLWVGDSRLLADLSLVPSWAKWCHIQQTLSWRCAAEADGWVRRHCLRQALPKQRRYGLSQCYKLPQDDQDRSETMFPLIFSSLCAHEISFVQHFTGTWGELSYHFIQHIERYELRHVTSVSETLCICYACLCTHHSMSSMHMGSKCILCVRSMISCVSSSHDLWACTQAHSLEGTVVIDIVCLET